MQYTVTSRIQAKPETIWKLLTDAAGYAGWNPTVSKVEGTIAPGNGIKVFAKISPNRAFSLKVRDFTPPRSMVWQGGMPLGLFKGVRTFTLNPRGDGSTDFTMTEVFSGPMLGLIRRTMPDLQPVFEEFAAALKRRAEAS